jgi:hypothetical protein
MSRYIDQDQIAELARHSTIGIDANDIMRFPSIEVIHCKDCKYRGEHAGADFWKCEQHGVLFKPTDFCSYAKRRESE